MQRQQRKKMRLNREVVRNLSSEEAKLVGGGVSVGTCSWCVDTYCCQRSVEYACRPSNNPLAC